MEQPIPSSKNGPATCARTLAALRNAGLRRTIVPAAAITRRRLTGGILGMSFVIGFGLFQGMRAQAAAASGPSNGHVASLVPLAANPVFYDSGKARGANAADIPLYCAERSHDRGPHRPRRYWRRDPPVDCHCHGRLWHVVQRVSSLSAQRPSSARATPATGMPATGNATMHRTPADVSGRDPWRPGKRQGGSLRPRRDSAQTDNDASAPSTDGKEMATIPSSTFAGQAKRQFLWA